MAIVSKTTTPASKPGAAPANKPGATPANKPGAAPASKPATPPKTQTSPSAPKPNNKTEIAQDMTKLDDVAIISDVLSCQKGLVKRYTNALCEVSCENLRTLVNSQLSECANDQFDSFLYMNQRNLYPTDPAPIPKVTQAKQKYMQKKNKMTN